MRRTWALSVLCGLVPAVVAQAAEDPHAAERRLEKPEADWLVPPGREQAVIGLLAPYYEAPGLPRISTVSIQQTVVRVTVESDAQPPVVLELQHMATETTLPADVTVVAHLPGADLGVVAARRVAIPAPVRLVAEAIASNRARLGTALWVANPKKAERAHELAKLAAEPDLRSTHRGLLSEGAQEALTWAALILGLVGGVGWGLWRRRNARGPRG